MKIAIDCGHSMAVGSFDGGAEGCGKLEQNLTREVGGLVMAKLQKLGHEVINCTCDDCSSLTESLAYRTNTANNNGAEIFVSIHFNASNGEGHGTEVFTYNGNEIAQARNILNNIVALGYTNRGIKGERLYVTSRTNMTAMLVECCFIDNEDDMSRYNANNFADAIVKGLVGQTVDVGVVQDNQPIAQEVKSPIQKAKEFVGSRCLELQQKLIAKGYNCGGYGADGSFGQGTYDSLIQFQKDNPPLVCDGLAGTLTFAKLNEVAEATPIASQSPTSNNVLLIQQLCNSLGANISEDSIYGNQTESAIQNLPLCGIPYTQRECTRFVQSVLGIDVDGVFLYETERYLKEFQSNQGNLTVDGICGFNSYKALALS